MAKKADNKPEIKPPPEPAARSIPTHRCCPLCFHGQGGTGLCYSKRGNTSYYKCQLCGHTWTAIVRVEVVRVEHRIVEIQQRDHQE